MKLRLLASLLLCLTIILSVEAQNTYENSIDSFRQVLVNSALSYDKNPPLKAEDTSFLSYYPIDSSWLIVADFQKLNADTFLKIPTTAGTEKIFKILGKAHFTHNGVRDTLTVYQPFRNGLQNYIFIPFRDQTSGSLTYGGGRYIELPLNAMNEDESTIKLDFNKAYNPWCAYSSGYFCPIPPSENDLKIAVHAGEKKFEK